MWNIKKIISIVICMSVIAGSNMVNASVEPKTTWLKSGYGILGSFNEGLIKVTINGKDGSYGFIDKSGNLKISPKYNSKSIYDSQLPATLKGSGL